MGKEVGGRLVYDMGNRGRMGNAKLGWEVVISSHVIMTLCKEVENKETKKL